jgi:hypothetical protein
MSDKIDQISSVTKKYEYLEIVKKNKKCGLDEKKLLNLYNDGCFGDVIYITEKIC